MSLKIMEGLVSRHKKMLHIRVMGVQKLLPKRFISPGFEVISVGSNRGGERDNLCALIGNCTAIFCEHHPVE